MFWEATRGSDIFNVVYLVNIFLDYSMSYKNLLGMILSWKRKHFGFENKTVSINIDLITYIHRWGICDEILLDFDEEVSHLLG